jgi:hypothetical protein
LKNLKTILEISRYQNTIKALISKKTQNPTSPHEKRGLKTPPLLTRNGVFVFISQHPLWLGLTDYIEILKWNYQEPADLSRICGSRDGVCSRFGDIPLTLWLREIRGRGHFSHLKLFLCAERKFVATDLRLPLKPRRASAPNHPIIRDMAGLDSEFGKTFGYNSNFLAT